jgi:flagellar basal body-associated protein FliL
MIIIFLLILAVVFGLAIAAFVTWAILSERKKEEK